MTDTDVNNARGFQVRSPLIRKGPWVSDRSWIGHHMLQLFGRVHQHLPGDGLWRLTGKGPELVRRNVPRLSEVVERMDAAAEPCVLEPVDAEFSPSVNEAMQRAMEGTEVVWAVALDGSMVPFDNQIVFAASIGADLSWHLTEHDGRAVLLGRDRKDRPRFALASLVENPAEVES